MIPRAKVWRVQRGQWAFSVYAGDQVIFTDNGGSWATNYRMACDLLWLLRQIGNRGYSLRYADKPSKRWYGSLRVGVPS